MPLSRDVSLTTRNDFGITRSNPYDSDTAARDDYRNTFCLQAVWKPAELASHGLRVMADYSFSYDTARAADSGVGNDVSLYDTAARLALALRFATAQPCPSAPQIGTAHV